MPAISSEPFRQIAFNEQARAQRRVTLVEQQERERTQQANQIMREAQSLDELFAKLGVSDGTQIVFVRNRNGKNT